MMKTIFYIYLSVLFISSIIFVVRYRILDPATRAICWMVWFALVTELIARYAAIQYRNNLPVYNVYFFGYFLLIMRYFYLSNEAIRNSKLMRYLVPIVVLAAIGSMLFLKPFLTSLNVHFVTLQLISISALALYSLRKRRRLAVGQGTDLSQVHVWIPLLLLLGQTATICSWPYYSPWNEWLGDVGLWPSYAILIINILVYAGFGVLALRYPRLNIITYEVRN